MNIAVRYFTKSGNTEKLAKAIAEEVNVPAETIDQPLDKKVDVLFLGCSYYAFDMDPAVKEFIHNNQGKIGKIALFGTSAMMKSMKKPMKKVTGPRAIIIEEEEFHCPGSFGFMHKDRPNEMDLEVAKAFAAKVVGK